MTAAGFSSQRNHLLARIHRHYETREQLLRIGHLELRFTSIANPDRVLDDAAEAEASAVAGAGRPSVPYWAELWDSAGGLAQWLVKTYPGPAGAAALAGPGVLDLGCGMGLSGVCAAALGAHVTFADFETLPLLFARLNSLPWRERTTTRRMDWRIDSTGEHFALILGADILYERNQWAYLERFWRQHLTAGGSVVLGEPGRQTGSEFGSWIASHGWKLNETGEIAGADRKAIRILQLQL